MVLLFSFFFCSGGFLVAHGEEPGNDNTGYLPSVLLGNLNITKGEGLDKNGLGYAVLNGSHQTLFHSTTSGILVLLLFILVNSLVSHLLLLAV